jgi:hypothetical protein
MRATDQITALGLMAIDPIGKPWRRASGPR